MAAQVTNYKCPACTGALHFVGASGRLECEFCGSSFDVAEMEAMHAGAEQKAANAWDTSGFDEWSAEEGMKAYVCPSCGAELICDETTAATSCPYCGNPTVVPGQFAGGLKPDCIIPFKLDQNAAKDALARFYKGKRFLPNDFASANKIREVKGVYVPFWLYDGEAYADAMFEATNSHTYTSGDYEITETAHYDVRRAGIVPFEKIPVDASTKMPDEYMDAIEPFDYSELRPFSTAYLPGFLADRYDVSAEESAARADERAANTAVAAMEADISGYGTCTMRNYNVDLRRGQVHYGLLPVYLLCTKWNGKDYLFAMNGQTGKLIGNLPIDRKKYWTWFAGIAGAVTVVLGSILLSLL